ncbi:MAG: hypothetical protein KGL78_13810 [Burkholderiales bacterium]|nr:hypothetical protein [Burkholderiales bacterium]
MKRWRVALATTLVAMLVLVALTGAALWVFARQPSLVVGWLLPTLEQRLADAIGMPVQVGASALRRDGQAVIVELDDLSIRQRDGRPVLQAPKVVVTWASAMRVVSSAGPEAIEIDGPRVELVRGSDGRVRLGDIALEPGGASLGRWESFAAELRQLTVRSGALIWIDAARGAAPVAFSDVEIGLHPASANTTATLAATPPTGWGDRLTASANWRGNSWASASGSVDVKAPRAELQPWRTLFGLPAAVDRVELGSGRLDLHAEFDATRPSRPSRLSRLQADLDRGGVMLAAAAPHRPPLQLRDLRMQADYAPPERSGASATLVLRDLAFDTEDGRHWPRGRLSLGWSCPAAPSQAAAMREALTGGCASQLDADVLDLSLLDDVALHLPLAPEVHAQLLELRPRGLAHHVRLRWNPGAPQALALHAEVSALAFAAGRPAADGAPARPGLDGAHLVIDLADGQGQAELALVPGTLTLPGALADPALSFDDARATLRFRVAQAAGKALALKDVQVDAATFRKGDGSGSFTAHWQAAQAGKVPSAATTTAKVEATTTTTAAAPPAARLDLDGTLADVDVSRLARTLPLALPAALRRELRAALLAGRIRRASVAWHGALGASGATASSPATAWPPPLAVQADLDGVTLDPNGLDGGASHWPLLTALAAHLQLDTTGLAFGPLQARSGALALQGVQGRLVASGAAPLLQLTGEVRGPLSQMAVVAQGLLTQLSKATLPKFAADTASSLQGQGDLSLALRLPLGHAEGAEASGQLAFSDAALRPLPGWPRVEQVGGSVSFGAQGVRVQARTQDFLGGPLQVAGGRAADGAWRLQAQGSASAGAIAVAAGVSKAMRAAFGGTLRYDAALAWSDGETPRIDLTSDLVGLAVDLPYPMTKTAAQALPLHVYSDGAEAWRVQIGALAQGCAAPSPRGDLRVALVLTAAAAASDAQAARSNASCQPPPEGERLTARIDRLDLAAWQAAAHRLAGGAAQTAMPAAAAAGPSSSTRDLHVEVASLRWHDIDLGRLRLASSGSEVARHIELDLTAGKSSLTGQALCTSGMLAPAQATPPGWTFTLNTEDAGALLDRLDWHHVMEGGQGSIRGKAPCTTWSDPAGYRAQMELDLTKGSLPAIKPGVARVLGALSLGSLVRRLKGDLSDLEDTGFAFDRFEGPVTLAPGLVLDAQLQLQGPSAAVTIDGRVGLASRTQDLHLGVTPTTDLGAASLGYALVNPALGLGSLAAQFLLHAPLAALTRREYRVCGSWHDPLVHEIDAAAGAKAPPECPAIAIGATGAAPPITSARTPRR